MDDFRLREKNERVMHAFSLLNFNTHVIRSTFSGDASHPQFFYILFTHVKPVKFVSVCTKNHEEINLWQVRLVCLWLLLEAPINLISRKITVENTEPSRLVIQRQSKQERLHSQKKAFYSVPLAFSVFDTLIFRLFNLTTHRQFQILRIYKGLL